MKNPMAFSAPTAEAVLSVARDYARTPGPRYVKQGKYSGEGFRRLLAEKLKTFATVQVDLDGTAGYGSSFIDEAFGGLVRESASFGFTKDELLRRVSFKSSEDPSYKVEAEDAMREAEPEAPR